MQIPTDINLRWTKVAKIAGLAIVAIVVIALAIRLIGSSFSSLFTRSNTNSWTNRMALVDDSDIGYGTSGEMAYDKAAAGVGLSLRNVASSPSIAPMPGNTTGDNAEEYEVKEYNVMVETRHLDNTCQTVADLKARPEVIFESAAQYEHNCRYTFKVKNDSVAEILKIIEALDPKELNANTYTIKRLIEDYTNQTEILEKKMNSIDETLANAVSAYDNIMKLANRVQDVESLAKIIESKLNIIERLTQERLNVSTQLEQLARAKAEQLDRLDYTYFYVNIIENKFIDWQNLKDSWKAAIKSFIGEVNEVLQDITINLAAGLLLVLKYILYLLIILLIAKYGWKAGKQIWNK